MPVASSPEHKESRSSTQTLQRAIWITLIALITVVILFVGTYTWDRYIRLDDRSPVDLGLAHMEDAVRQDPQDIEARVALADSYLAAGQYDAALEQTDQVLTLYPDNAGALLIAGIAAARTDMPEAALGPLEEFVAQRRDGLMARMDTALETALYFLGESYRKLDRPSDAIRALEAALIISPTDADALYQLGLAHQANGQLELALEAYHGAIRFVPDFAEVYQGMVVSYALQGQTDYEAYAQGMEAFSLLDHETALVYLEQATQALPDFAPARLGLGLTYEQLGRQQEALEALQRASELDPQSFVALQALKRIQASMDADRKE